MLHGLSMDNCAISTSIKVPYLPSDKKITRSTLNSKIDKVPWRKVASTFLGPATVLEHEHWASKTPFEQTHWRSTRWRRTDRHQNFVSPLAQSDCQFSKFQVRTWALVFLRRGLLASDAAFDAGLGTNWSPADPGELMLLQGCNGFCISRIESLQACASVTTIMGS